VIQYLPSICEALGSIPSPENGERKGKERRGGKETERRGGREGLHYLLSALLEYFFNLLELLIHTLL
jgi:hypothetical protein